MNGVALLRIAMIAVAVSLGSIMAASNEPQNSTPQEVFDGMRQSFQAEKAKGAHLRYQWRLTGPNGGEWWIEVNDGKAKFGRGKIDHPNVTFITSDNIWVALSNGKVSGFWATMTARMKVHGDRNLARQLGKMFP